MAVGGRRWSVATRALLALLAVEVFAPLWGWATRLQR